MQPESYAVRDSTTNRRLYRAWISGRLKTAGGVMAQTLSAAGLTTGHAPFVEEARDRGELYITQAYELYSEENHEAWRKLYRRIRPVWEQFANPHFLHGI